MAKDVARLCKKIEAALGVAVSASGDFEVLAREVFERTHEVVGINTLKRIWGHGNYGVEKPRRSTLDVLARFVGFADYSTFLRYNDGLTSDKVMTRHIVTKHLARGLTVELQWLPDRRVLVEHLGNTQFVVREVEHSKLQVGDTFFCNMIIEGEPIYLSNLTREGMSPTAYMAGKQAGVHFTVIED